MVTTAVLFVMMSAIANHFQSHDYDDTTNKKTDLNRFLQRLPWLFLVIITTAVSVSRVYIATHFPHQVILGAVIGKLLNFHLVFWYCSNKMYNVNVLSHPVELNIEEN